MINPNEDTNDDAIIYIPLENILAIERVINNWDAVKVQWDKLWNCYEITRQARFIFTKREDAKTRRKK
jgi:hypothetical protein